MRKTILLKLTGEILSAKQNRLSSELLRTIAEHIKQLASTHYINIVIGGGNFFRGSKEGVDLGMNSMAAHQVGITATIMNGLIIKDIFQQMGIDSEVFCAISCPDFGTIISPQNLAAAQKKNVCMIFTAGTGNPFFTTDTNAVLRGLQIDALEVWKGTNVDGIYENDPKQNPHAALLKKVTYQELLQRNLRIMDSMAIALAQEHQLPIKVFNIFTQNALLNAADDPLFGSIIH